MDNKKINSVFNKVRGEMSKNSSFRLAAVVKETTNRLVDKSSDMTESEYKAVYDHVLSCVRNRQ